MLHPLHLVMLDDLIGWQSIWCGRVWMLMSTFGLNNVMMITSLSLFLWWIRSQGVCYSEGRVHLNATGSFWHPVYSSYFGHRSWATKFVNVFVSSIGRVFRPPLWRWWKMAVLPLPAAILDDLIPGTRKWGHPRWRPEAEGPPFSTTTTMGVEKLSPGLGWRHFRRRHLGIKIKMAAPQITSGGRLGSHEILRKGWS